MGSADLTSAQYAAYDWNTASDDLRARAQVKFAADFNDFVASSLAIMLLDLVAFGIDTLSFYLDRRATDNYLSTAITRKSIARLTRQLGYKMRAAVSSSTDLDVTIVDPGFNVTMPKGFQFYGPNQLIFETAQDITWLHSDSSKTKIVPVYEGQTVTENFVSDGTANQVFQLRRVPSGKFVTAGTVTVAVNGIPYTENEFLTFEDSNQFEVGYNDDPPTIRFGDGKGAGNIPANGASIVVTYVASSGLAGLVNAGTINSTVNDLVVSFQVISMTINNPLGSIGGDDPETLDHAKLYAPLVYKTRMVAVTRSDYESLSNAFSDPLYGAVAVAQALSSRSAASDTELTNLLDEIMSAVSEPVHIAGTEVLLGTVDVSTSGIVTGTNTFFTDQLQDGDWVKFGSGSTYYSVVPLSIISDTQLTVAPVPSVALTGVTVTLVGSSIKAAGDRLDAVDADLVLISNPSGSPTSGYLVDIKTATNAANGSMESIRTLLSTDKTSVTGMGSNATAITTDASSASSTISGTVGSPFVISGSSPPDGNVVYFPLQANVQIVHQTVTSFSVTVLGNVITVTLASGGTTARDVVAGINAVPAAAALVQASFQGTGSANAGTQTLTAIPVFLPSSIKNTLGTELEGIKSNASSISSSSSLVVSHIGTNIGYIDSAEAQLNTIGLSFSSGTKIYAINAARTDIATQVGASGLRLDISTIATAVQDQYDAVHAYTGWPLDSSLVAANIYDHVDTILSADCRANLVTVPILARDRAGFFTAPSIGLITALKNFLNNRKEVTQTVAVVSGESALVPVRLKIRIGLASGYSEAVAKSSVVTVAESLLRDRKFGASLYLSDITSAVLTVDGVVYSDPRITQPSSVDEYGDLIIESGQVITKDSSPDAIEIVVLAASSVLA